MDSERWRSCPDAHDYLVSDEGNIRRLMPDGTWRELRPSRNSKGYRKVDLWLTNDAGRRVRRTSYVHHLVMFAFVGPRPEDHDIDHADGNQLNNTLPNLRYVPSDENRWDWHGAWRQETPA